MKRFVTICLAAAMCFAAAACSNDKPADNPPATTAPTQAPAPVDIGTPESDGAVGFETGLGIVTNFGGEHTFSYTPANGDVAAKDGTAEVDSTVVALTVQDGVITKISIDVAQSSVKFNDKGEITSDVSGAVPSKLEKGDDYGMKRNPAAIGEWYEQAAGFEAWALGKTVDEVTKLAVNAEGHTTDADVAATTTISVGDFIGAVAKAAANMRNGEADYATYKTGLGVVTNFGGEHTAAATAEADGTAEVDSTVCVLTLDGDVIKYIAIDVAQSSVKFNNKGEITSDISGTVPSKLEKGDNYGMKRNPAAIGEWYEQAAGFEAWALGKTVDEVTKLAVNAEGHTTDADVAATTTISVGDFIQAVAKAAANAK